LAQFSYFGNELTNLAQLSYFWKGTNKFGTVIVFLERN
jgi:hypothetical protein